MPKSLSYYFASRYNRHPELRGYRAELLAAIPGASVTSRWIDCHDGTLETSLTPETLSADPGSAWEYGAHDIEDLEAAHTLVSFTGPGGKGGRHIEHGYAMAAGKRIIIVGPRENVFHCWPAGKVYVTWQAFLAAEIATYKTQAPNRAARRGNTMHPRSAANRPDYRPGMARR